nr:TIM-barrel domain-containing protein [Actinoplanes bogorensis]
MPPTRRDLLKVAGLAAVPLPALADLAADESLTGYASHVTGVRSVTVTSTTGQRLRISAYGGHLVRIQAVRAGEEFFADNRYEMVDPAAHSGLGGTLQVADTGDTLTITTGPLDGVRVVLRKNPLRLTFAARDEDTVLAGEDATHSMGWGATVRQTFAPAGADERFVKAGHGLYGRAPRVDRTGEIVAHNYPLQSNHIDQAPAIVPLYFSSRGYAVFFNTTFDTTFNFGNGGTYEFSADAHGASGAQPQLDYFFIKGPEFTQLLDRYTQLTGRPRFPRLGVFGLQLSDKNFPNVSDQNWWTSRITALRDAGYPLDVQVHDNRWRAGSGGWSGSWFEFSPQRWPDPAGFKRWADEHGVLTTLDYNRNNSNEMAGWVGGPPPGYSFRAADLTGVDNSDAVPDWSNPATRAWVWNVFWSKAFNPALGYPGDALWIDEPDEMGPIPYDAVAANGQRWAELRNAFFLYCQKGVGQEGWDRAIGRTKRPWTFTRGATAGQQRYGHLWTGDINSTYGEMQEQIRGMLNAGLGGFPFANIDAGGFFGAIISDGLYRNWVAAWASVSPIWRPHSNGDTGVQGPAASRWPIDQGAANQADFRKYAKVRYTLMPYIYSIAHTAYATGVPMARAMVIEHQRNPMAYTHDLQYMWGPSILVMPVTTDTGGAVQRVWLPAGDTWFNFWSERAERGLRHDREELRHQHRRDHHVRPCGCRTAEVQVRTEHRVPRQDATRDGRVRRAGRVVQPVRGRRRDRGLPLRRRVQHDLAGLHARRAPGHRRTPGRYLQRGAHRAALRRPDPRAGGAGRDAGQRRGRAARVHRGIGRRAQRQRPGLERHPQDPDRRHSADHRGLGRRGRGDRRAQRRDLPRARSPDRVRSRGRPPQRCHHRLAARGLHRQRLRRLHQCRR